MTCISDANPTVEESGYTWDISGTEHTGSYVTLEEEHEGVQLVECCAKNEIRGVTYKECDQKLFDVQSEQ